MSSGLSQWNHLITDTDINYIILISLQSIDFVTDRNIGSTEYGVQEVHHLCCGKELWLIVQPKATSVPSWNPWTSVSQVIAQVTITILRSGRAISHANACKRGSLLRASHYPVAHEHLGGIIFGALQGLRNRRAIEPPLVFLDSGTFLMFLARHSCPAAEALGTFLLLVSLG